MANPRYTDKTKYPNGYATAQASREPGYLAKRFAEIRDRERLNAEERLRKTIQIRKAK